MCHWCTEHGDRDEKWYTTYENFLFDKIFPTLEEQEEVKKKIVSTFTDTEWRYSEPKFIRNKEFLINRSAMGFGSQIITKEECQRIFDLAFEATEREDSMVVAGHCPCRLVYDGTRDYCCVGFGMPVTMSMEVAYGRLPREGVTEFGGAEWRDLRRELRKDAKVPLKKNEVKELLTEWERRGLWHIVMSRGRLPLIEAICNCESRYCTYWRNRELMGVPDYVRKGHYLARIDPLKCTQCARCIDICDFGAISYSRIAQTLDIDFSKCFGCGLCRSVCAPEAISLVPRIEIPAASRLW